MIDDYTVMMVIKGLAKVLGGGWASVCVWGVSVFISVYLCM